MTIVPRLPDNAPFSLAQRAWLDGFIVGLTGWDEAAEVAPAPPAPAIAPVEEEDFPWHDPALSLDERLALAAGRRPEHLLMAAMAQLDCGQCGYLCHSYAKAIASGAEPDLARCVPGGKTTSRKLKELTAAVAGSKPAPASVAPLAMPTPPMDDHKPGEILQPVRFCSAHRLNRPGSEKDTRHIVFGGAEVVAYEAGDSLGVVARNAPELVAAIIERLGAKPDTTVRLADGGECGLAEALLDRCEIRRVSDQAIVVLASRAHDRSQSVILQAMAEGYPGAGPEDADLLDLLEAFPSARPPLSELVSAPDPLRPRLYSIASSPKAGKDEIHLVVEAVRYQKRARPRHGVASTYLSDRLGPDETVSVFVHRAPGFRLPAGVDTPIVMIGAGTGLAPFRVFLQERRALGTRARNWLVFGNQRRSSDFLFQAELEDYHRDGLLTRLDTAFSRDQADKVYVQHRLLEQAATLWAWLAEGAHLYLCGDAQRLARDVEAGLVYIIAREGGMPSDAAKAHLAALARDGRYHKDVY